MWSNWAVIFVRGCCTSWKAQIGKAPGAQVGPIPPQSLRIGSFQKDEGLRKELRQACWRVCLSSGDLRERLASRRMRIYLFQTDGGVSTSRAGWKQAPLRVCPSLGRRSASRRGSGGASSSPPSSPSSLESSLSFLFVFFKLLYAKRFVSFPVSITFLDSW